MPDIVLANVPFINKVQKTIIYRPEKPQLTSWEDIFQFLESEGSLPRKYLTISDENGKKVYGKNKLYSSFNYEKLRMKDLKGDYTSTAYVNVNIITEFSR